MFSVVGSRLSVVGGGKKVALGLSGGVDSGVSAALLKEQGYGVEGVFLECWRAPGCRVDEDRKDALAVAMQLGIPYRVLDFKNAYRDRVVEYFYREYEAGRTPNPDTMCNREIKFGLFYEWAMKSGFDAVATGHYARILEQQATSNRSQENVLLDSSQAQNGNKFYLQRGRDERKDQSYFLYLLRPEQLEHVLFPIGQLTKAQVREEAKKRKLPVAEKPDSQGICFIGEVNMTSFLKERIIERSGEIVWRLSDESLDKIKNEKLKIKTTSKKIKLIDNCVVVGRHKGVPFYTIGQKISSLDKAMLKRLFQEELFPVDPAEMPAMFVVDKDVKNNRLVVGFEEELLVNEFEVEEVNWLVPVQSRDMPQAQHDPGIKQEVFVRIRHGGRLFRARLKKQDSRLQVTTKKPLKGVASGQACVFYSDESMRALVLGGGVVV